jgi:hypothetical protein
MWKESRLQPEHRFWVRLLAACAVAARFTEHLEILPFSPMRVVDWAIDKAQGLSQDSDNHLQGSHSASSALSSFLTEHMNAMLVVEGGGSRNKLVMPLVKPVGTLLCVRYERSTGGLYISEGVFRTWAAKHGVFVRETLGQLKDQRVVLGRHKMITLGAGTEYPTGQIACIHIDGHHPMLSGALKAVNDEEKRYG